MLRELKLSNFVIVRQLSIEFKQGFNVLTGETGAGKSILIDALALILGGRGDANVIREGANKADLSAEFETTPAVQTWLSQRELNGDEGTVWLRRLIDTDGRSKAFINGHPSTLQALKEIAAMLVDIHGQHASIWLTRSDSQRELLDAIAGVASLSVPLKDAFIAWRSAQTRLAKAHEASAGYTLERERLQWLADELKSLQPRTGEWQLLSDEHKRLANAAELIAGTQAATQALEDRDQSLIAEVEQLSSRIRQLAISDKRLDDSCELLDQASISLREAADALSHYVDHAELDPQRLNELDARITLLHNAARKFKIAPDALPNYWQQTSERLVQLSESQDIAALEQQTLTTKAQFDQLADQVSLLRKKASIKVGKAVSKGLDGLGMAGATMSIQVSAGTAAEHGHDSVEFMISAHAKSNPRPMSKVASGGELSRVSLALAVVAAHANPVPTIIFDEADAGVGGGVAQMVGQLMRELGTNRQVLCVTHLPQVAALGHEHFQVKKVSSKDGVVSQVERLNREGRVEEVARMLGGVELTATSRKHALELIALGNLVSK